MATTARKEHALEVGLVQTIFRPCAEALLKVAEPQSGQRLLDIGCGSGIVARAALELQPGLVASHGFDNEQEAVDEAVLAASTHRFSEKLSFWKGHAGMADAYRGEWDVCVAQHVLQHVPAMLGPLLKALVAGGRAIIATWPVSSESCPAYDFLYTASGDGTRVIGLSLEDLRARIEAAGFHDVSAFELVVKTPPIAPGAFLQQYLEGKTKEPPKDIGVYVSRPEVAELAAKRAASRDTHGNVVFDIVMHVAVATAH